MDLLSKLTIKNLKLNKKRTIVTIIGIMLSVALITAVATMYSSAIKSLINYETYHQGHFHVAFHDVPLNEVNTIKNNRGIGEVYLTSNIGYANLPESKNDDKPYVFVKGFTSKALKNLSVKLIDGRLPQNEKEVLIPSHLKTNGRVVLNIGDSITLDIGKRFNDEEIELFQDNPFNLENNEELKDTQTKTYKIVGMIERPATNIESYTAPGYTFITFLNKDSLSNKVDVYAKYTKNGSRNYLSITSNILQIDENIFKNGFKHNFKESEEKEYDRYIEELEKAKYDFNINGYLLQLENNPLGDEAMGGLGVVVAIVCIIIVISSVFCIKNSFDISITEKIKQYGMLRSIGATKKQIKKNVFYEGTILGLIGIPLGILLGFVASYILVIISNLLMKDMFSDGLELVLSFSWVAAIIAILLGIITIYFSALRSANKAAKVSPMDSIRNSADIKIKSKKMKSPPIIRKLFGIGGDISYKNIKRNKKKYRTTVISIIVSTAVFIALSYFISGAFNGVKKEITTYDYNISLTIQDLSNNKTLESKSMDTLNLDNIDDYSTQKNGFLAIKNPQYTKEYIEIGNFGDDFIKNDGHIFVLSIGDYQFRKYLKKLNLSYNEYQNKAILVAGDEKFEVDDEETGKTKDKYATEFKYKNGDVIEIYNEENETKSNIKIGYVTKTNPFGGYQMKTYLVVSDSMFNELIPKNNHLTIYYLSSNPDKLQDDIDEVLNGEEYYLSNIEEQAKLMNNLFTLIAIFLYGFIIVITLIGITNIFNTITTNMNLRKQEFAMLKSIGMTSREFSKMIRIESVFIGARSLLFGIPIGIAISYLIYHFMEKDNGFVFKMPISAIVLSIVAVNLLITIFMRYSMNKLNKENTIETIRNENI